MDKWKICDPAVLAQLRERGYIDLTDATGRVIGRGMFTPIEKIEAEQNDGEQKPIIVERPPTS